MGNSASGGFHPFWFWNDDLDVDKIRRQIHEMAEQGVKGFYIHPRQGLRTPYLSAAFFDMVKTAIQAARACGLVANLYDEYPYPSGAAGGETTLGHPEFLATRLIQTSHDTDGGPVRLPLPRGCVLFCRAYPLDQKHEVDWASEIDLQDDVGMVLAEDSYNETALTAYNRKRYFASQPTPTLSTCLPSGRWRVFVAAQGLIEAHKYWGHYLDVLDPDAVARFIELTHERYARHVGEHFGKTIRSIFLDEAAPHWSRHIPGWFRRRYDYDLIDLLPALQTSGHPQHHQVSADLTALRYERFCESFEKPVRNWCERHGLLYAGEKPSLRLSQLRYMGMPGCDCGHTRAGDPMDLLGATLRSNARATASAAYFYDKEGSLCECYHSLGWGATLQDAKLIAEELLLMGIRQLVPHGFFYSTHALRKHDAPPSFFFQMPYWPMFGELARRVDAIQQQFEGTHIEARVLVVDPTPGQPTAADNNTYEQLQQLLMEEHIDFMTVDVDILEAAGIQDGRVVLRDIAAEMVIVPPMQVTEPALQRWLDGYVGSGGRVLRIRPDFDAERTREQLFEAAPASLNLTAETGDASRIHMVTRRDGHRRLWFLINTSSDAVTLRIDAEQPLREVQLPAAPQAALEETPDGWRRQLAPFESVLLCGGEKDDKAAPAPVHAVHIPVGGACCVKPASANLLRLGHWDLCLVDAAGAEGPVARVPAVPLANQLKMAALSFAPAIREGFGQPPTFELPPLHLRYRRTVECDFDGPLTLLMEPGSIVGQWQLQINDTTIGPADLAPVAIFIPGCIGVDISPFVVSGRNTLRVDVETNRRDAGLLNPLYLAGDFGVRLDPVGLTARKTAGVFEDYIGNQLPHYAGIVEYNQTFELADAVAAGYTVGLMFAAPFTGALEASFNGGPCHLLPFSPYRLTVGAGELRPGVNELRLKVYTTLAGAFDGNFAAQE